MREPRLPRCSRNHQIPCATKALNFALIFQFIFTSLFFLRISIYLFFQILNIQYKYISYVMTTRYLIFKFSKFDGVRHACTYRDDESTACSVQRTTYNGVNSHFSDSMMSSTHTFPTSSMMKKDVSPSLIC